MTVKRLRALLDLMISQGNGCLEVVVDKSSFNNPLEDEGCVILPVDHIALRSYPLVDGDGFSVKDSVGREKLKSACVMDGGYRGERGM